MSSIRELPDSDFLTAVRTFETIDPSNIWSIAYKELEPSDQEGPTADDNPIAQLIGTAKRELSTWLSCNTITLASLLGMSRQTLHDADNPQRKPHAKTAAKILDVHALLSSYVSAYEVTRLAWLRGPGVMLWSERGLEAFQLAIEEQLFPSVAQRSTYGVTIDGQDEEAQPNDAMPSYRGRKRRF